MNQNKTQYSSQIKNQNNSQNKKNKLPIFVKWMEFLKWLLPLTDKFPKKARFTFADRINNLALDIVEDLIEAQYQRDKLAILRKANLRLEKLRILMRISCDMHFISYKSYEFAVRSINEAGKMLGGWIKQVSRK